MKSRDRLGESGLGIAIGTRQKNHIARNYSQVTPSRLGRTRSQGTTNAGQATSGLERKILVRQSSTRRGGDIQPTVEIHVRVVASSPFGDLKRHVE